MPGMSQKRSPVGCEAAGHAVHAVAGSSLPPNSVLKLAKKKSKLKRKSESVNNKYHDILVPVYLFPVQGGPSACTLRFVDIKSRVVLYIV